VTATNIALNFSAQKEQQVAITKTYQKPQHHCKNHHSHPPFNMIFIAILLLALLGINQANAGVRISNTLSSNNTN